MELIAQKQDHWFIFDNDQLLLKMSNDTDHLLSNADIHAFKPHLENQHQLYHHPHCHQFCASLNKSTILPADIHTCPLRKALNLFGETHYSDIVRAYSIIQWDKNHQFCGRCGHPTEHKQPIFERICNTCGLTMYPRISPSIIVRIKKGNQILMSRSPHFPPGTYGLIAGFVEAGENLEEAVHREVKEEIGITIANLHYFGSQPWPFPDSLMIGFTADYANGELLIDHTEIEDAGWYNHDELPGWPSSSVSIAKKLIDHFINEQKSLK